MKVVAIIQARMGSTRLPGKVLQDIGGRTMLDRVVSRTRRATTADGVLVATTREGRDDAIVQEAVRLGVPVFRGDEEDVLGRYYEAARSVQADVILRITADCPLIDPEIIDRVVRALLEAHPTADFAANTLARTFPKGLDVEVATFQSLERVYRQALSPEDRAHVFPFIYRNRDQFRSISITDAVDRSWMRWTVDTADDLAFVRAIYAQFEGRDDISWHQVLECLSQHPQLLSVNHRHRAPLPFVS